MNSSCQIWKNKISENYSTKYLNKNVGIARFRKNQSSVLLGELKSISLKFWWGFYAHDLALIPVFHLKKELTPDLFLISRYEGKFQGNLFLTHA